MPLPCCSEDAIRLGLFMGGFTGLYHLLKGIVGAVAPENKPAACVVPGALAGQLLPEIPPVSMLCRFASAVQATGLMMLNAERCVASTSLWTEQCSLPWQLAEYGPSTVHRECHRPLPRATQKLQSATARTAGAVTDCPELFEHMWPPLLYTRRAVSQMPHCSPVHRLPTELRTSGVQGHLSEDFPGLTRADLPAGVCLLLLPQKEARRTLALYVLTRAAECTYNSLKQRNMLTFPGSRWVHNDALLFAVSSAQVCLKR